MRSRPHGTPAMPRAAFRAPRENPRAGNPRRHAASLENPPDSTPSPSGLRIRRQDIEPTSALVPSKDDEDAVAGNRCRPSSRQRSADRPPLWDRRSEGPGSAVDRCAAAMRRVCGRQMPVRLLRCAPRCVDRCTSMRSKSLVLAAAGRRDRGPFFRHVSPTCDHPSIRQPTGRGGQRRCRATLTPLASVVSLLVCLSSRCGRRASASTTAGRGEQADHDDQQERSSRHSGFSR